MAKKMNALVYKGKESIVLENVDVPKLNEGEALIKVAYAGICGSDLTIYAGKNPRVPLDTIIGHELSGEIVEIRGCSEELRIGDKVTAEPIVSCGMCFHCITGHYNVCKNFKLLGVYTHGGFAEYVKARLDRIYKLPDGVSMKAGALIEPLSVAVHAVRQSRLKYGDSAVIIGSGPIGLLVAHVARAAGANILMSDVNDYRLGLAAKAGFDAIDSKAEKLGDAVEKRFGSIGADVVFECAGVRPAMDDSIRVCRSKGQIVVVAAHKDPCLVDLCQVHLKELNLQGVKVYNFQDYRAALGILASNQIDTESFVSHIFTLDKFGEGVALMLGGRDVMKVLLDLTGY